MVLATCSFMRHLIVGGMRWSIGLRRHGQCLVRIIADTTRPSKSGDPREEEAVKEEGEK